MSGAAELNAALDTELTGEVPNSIASYTEADPELLRSYMEFRSNVLDRGIVSRKDKLLMALAVLTAQKAEGPLAMYSRIASSNGATGDEIKEAIRVGVLFSGGAGIAAAAESGVSRLFES